VCLCDVLIVFGRTEGDGSPLQHFSLDESLKAEMASFIIDYVFSDTDSELSGTYECVRLNLPNLKKDTRLLSHFPQM